MNKKPYLLTDFVQTEKEGKMAIEVHSPQCPKCLNVDGRWTLRHDKHNATIISIMNYQTSGSEMKCLCCNAEFNWCSGDSHYGIIKNERKNDVLVPIEYFAKVLGIDPYRYL
jgi:hypothetical protein